MEKRNGSLLLCDDYCYAGNTGITLRVLPPRKTVNRICNAYVDCKPQTGKFALKRQYDFGRNFVKQFIKLLKSKRKRLERE